MLTEQDVRRLAGLREADAAARLESEGPNELATARPRTMLAIALEVAREPMIALLVACGAIYVVLGDLQEAAALLVSVFGVVGISLYQTQKSERALEALRDLSSPRALVIRDGQERRIAGREVVRDDLLVLAEGDRVAADATLLWAANLRADESLLTGESVPVTKAPGDDGAPGRVFAGTMIVAGHGIARVHAIGGATELGQIGRALEAPSDGSTRLERDVRGFVRVAAVAGVVVCVLTGVGYGLSRSDWLGGLLAGLALAMAMMPEEFPVVLTLFLALGAWRISRRNVLVRRMPAVEALGSITVLCVDKTGTLTQNRMAATLLAADGRRYDVPGHAGEALPEDFHRLLEYAVLASQQNPFDPMERAINDLGAALLAGTEHLHRTWTLVREYPLSPELLAMSHVWRATEGERWVVAAKGAPEAVADLCHLGAAELRALGDEVTALADRGLRVLGVAAVLVDAPELPASQHDFPFELIGLVGLEDPVRPTAPAAVAECAAAGIRTVMITGDYAGTARSIAAQVGLPCDTVLTGADLDALDDAELARRVATVDVFARVVPAQKLRLVRALRAAGAVVAMTGDGVNDAPALRAADVGVAMGARGTDVAREAADMVLVDDDFSSLAAAIRLGRRVYGNLRKAMTYIVAIHVAIAGTALLPVLLGWPLVLLPLHIVLLELIIDPACSIVFEAEPEEPDVMRRPPRDPQAPLFRARGVTRAILQGVVALAATAGILAFALHQGYDDAHSRALAFTTIVLANLGLILAVRSDSTSALAFLRVRNPALRWVLTGALAMLALGLAAPPVRAVLRFGAPSLGDLLVVGLTAAVALVGFDVLKERRRPMIAR